MKTAIVGAGSWGTALAQVAAKNQLETTLWARREKLADEINKLRENREYLPGNKLSENISVSTNLGIVVENADIIIIAVPSQAMRKTVKMIIPYIKGETIIASASKGFELGSTLRMSQVIKEELGSAGSNVVVISGPSHAEEVIQNLPTAVVAASEDEETAKTVQKALINENFRVYTNSDVIGVELGGALKNIIALCAGISDGLGYGDNSRAALMARGIAEITRLGIKLGAQPSTFAGLSGIGDLFVTCGSRHSRNRRAGIQIGKGKKIDQILKSSKMVVEGIYSTKAAYSIAKKLNIEMPITEQAYLVLFEDKNPKCAVKALMSRSGKRETDLFLGKLFDY